MPGGTAIDWKFASAIGLGTIGVLIVWPTPFAYPVRLFVTVMHELGHAVATILTGGQVESIAIFPSGAGLTLSRGGNLFLIASAGYLGSLLVGAILLALAKRQDGSQRALQVLAVALLVADVAFVRNVFGFVVTLGLAVGFCAIACRVGPNSLGSCGQEGLVRQCPLQGWLDVHGPKLGDRELQVFRRSPGSRVSDPESGRLPRLGSWDSRRETRRVSDGEPRGRPARSLALPPRA